MSRTLYVCLHRRPGAGSCAGAGAEPLMAALRQQVGERGLNWNVRPSPCLGHCAHGPNIKVGGGPLLHHCDTAETVLAALLGPGPED